MALVVQVQGKRLDPVTPTAVMFLTAVINTVAQQQILNIWKPYVISCLQCWGKNPSEKNWVFEGKSKLGILTDWLVCIVYVCSGFMLVFSKLTKKIELRYHCFSVHGDTW